MRGSDNAGDENLQAESHGVGARNRAPAEVVTFDQQLSGTASENELSFSAISHCVVCMSPPVHRSFTNPARHAEICFLQKPFLIVPFAPSQPPLAWNQPESLER